MLWNIYRAGLESGLHPWEVGRYEYRELWVRVNGQNRLRERTERLAWETARFMAVNIFNASGNMKSAMGIKDMPLPWDKEASVEKQRYDKEDRKRIEKLAKELGL